MVNVMDMHGLPAEQQIVVNQIVEANKKNKNVLFVLWWFFAIFGGHRFYLGNNIYAVFMFLFGWMTLFIWPYVDIIFAVKELERQNARVRQDAINQVRIMHGGHTAVTALMAEDQRRADAERIEREADDQE